MTPRRHAPDPALLVPRPKRAELKPGAWSPNGSVGCRLVGIAPTDPAIECLRTRLARRGCDLAHGSDARVELDFALEPGDSQDPEAYALELDTAGVRVRAPRAAGLVYAARTLDQWLALHELEHGGEPVAGLCVVDRPDLVERGALLDVSRDRVPRMGELYALVERLASYKLNRLQLYFEASFAYEGCERVWGDASPFTAEEIRALDAFCRARRIELVPNQQSFGHLHKWLVHEPFRQLAECPEGIEHPFSPDREPFSLCPTDPRSLEFLAARYDELLSSFTSDEFNVGLDETFDLGLGRSKQACEERGRHRVYAEFLCAVEKLVAERGKRMQFWGDIVLEEPAILSELPENATAMTWGYDAEHPFERDVEAFRNAGLAFQVCPGTSSWNSIGGRVDNALTNLASAARAGHAGGARGMLTTDWGDRGHLQPAPVSDPGWLAAAEHAWNAAGARAWTMEELARRLDLFRFADPTHGMGRALVDLGRVDLASGARATNGTALFYLLAFALEPLPHPRIEALELTGLEHAEAAIDAALGGLDASGAKVADAPLVTEELVFAGDLLRYACALGRARLRAGKKNALAELPADDRRTLAASIEALASRHRDLWLRRSRPGGLPRSARWLERIGSALRA